MLEQHPARRKNAVPNVVMHTQLHRQRFFLPNDLRYLREQQPQPLVRLLQLRIFRLQLVLLPYQLRNVCGGNLRIPDAGFCCDLLLRDRLRGKAYLPLAYFEGATPENGYQPRVPYTLNVLSDPRPQDMEPGYMRVFLKTAGADSPRPMKLRQKASTGEWFLWEYSSILSGIRIPAAEDPWA